MLNICVYNIVVCILLWKSMWLSGWWYVLMLKSTWIWI